MYDFCFTWPYGGILILGGVLGFIVSGSVKSLMMGCLSGAILIGLGQLSLNAYHRGKLCKPATAMSLVISLVLTSAMYQRYTDTGKIVPAGVIMAISAMMALFYIWNLIFGPRPSGRTRED